MREISGRPIGKRGSGEKGQKSSWLTFMKKRIFLQGIKRRKPMGSAQCGGCNDIVARWWWWW